VNLVNGFVCNNCSDVEVAKKGIDPAHPHAPPKHAQVAKILPPGEPDLGVNRPDPPGTSSVGTELNLFA